MKAGDLKPCDIPLRTKVIYEGYMQMNPKYKSPYPPTVPTLNTEQAGLLVEKLESASKTDAEQNMKDEAGINTTDHKQQEIELQKVQDKTEVNTEKGDLEK